MTADTPRRPARSGSLVIERHGTQVALLVQCDDEYAAMKLHDEAVASAHSGKLTIDLTLNGVASER